MGRFELLKSNKTQQDKKHNNHASINKTFLSISLFDVFFFQIWKHVFLWTYPQWPNCVFCFIRLLFLFLLSRLMSFELNLWEKRSQYYISKMGKNIDDKLKSVYKFLRSKFKSCWVYSIWPCEVLEFERCINWNSLLCDVWWDGKTVLSAFYH